MNIAETFRRRKLTLPEIANLRLADLRPRREELLEIKCFMPGDEGFPDEEEQIKLIRVIYHILELSSPEK